MVKRQQQDNSLNKAAQDTKSLKKMCQLILTKSYGIIKMETEKSWNDMHNCIIGFNPEIME